MNILSWLLGATLSWLLCGAVALAEPSDTGASTDAVLVDLNHASMTELTRLPGIGEKRAEAILAFRESQGGFRNVTQLLKIKGIGRAMLRKLRLLVTVSAQTPKTPQPAVATASPPPPSEAHATTPVRTGSSDLHRVR